MVSAKGKAEQNPQRLIVMYEKHKSPYKWLLNTYQACRRRRATASSPPSKFDCAPNRGKTGKSFFIVNHWVDAGGTPDPIEAAGPPTRRRP